MKKLLIFCLFLVLISTVTYATSISRTVTPSSVASGGIFTIKYTLSGATGNYGGILYETAPAGFTISATSFLSTMDVFGKKITGQLVEMPFAGSATGQYIQFEIIAGSSSGTLSSGKVEWGSGAGTNNLEDICLKVDNKECTSSGGGTIRGGSSNSILIFVAIGIALVIYVMTKKK